MIASSPRGQFALNLFIKKILISNVVPKYLNCSTVLEDLLPVFIAILSCVLLCRHEHILGCLGFNFLDQFPYRRRIELLCDTLTEGRKIKRRT
jgi:hypothetical protein